ncbi:motility protein A [Thermoclostridium stercorarium]|uniref:motility protein A n=1 Tax=Thermoclostridium stercorarium TaxID=1510 RepID=UPI000A4190F8|nr:motility-associated protein [Thermoclostridium stercorarium]
MDLATLIGLIIGIACILWGMYDGGNPSAFWSLSSLAVTFGGGLASTIIAFTLDDFRNLLKVLPKLFKRKEQSPYKLIQLLVELSQKARREGLLALESNQEEIEDEYLKKALELVVDGVEPEIIRDSMQLELDNMSIRHGKCISIFKTLAAEFLHGV